MRCDAVRLQARLRVHIHLQSLPGVSLTVCDRAEAGGMSRLPQCRPVAVHIPVTRQRSHVHARHVACRAQPQDAYTTKYSTRACTNR